MRLWALCLVVVTRGIVSRRSLPGIMELKATTVVHSELSTRLMAKYDHLHFADAALERQFETSYIENNIRASLTRLSIFLSLALIAIIMRGLNVFNEFNGPLLPSAQLQLSIIIQFVCVALSLALVAAMSFSARARPHMQSILVIIVLISMGAVFISTQMGFNQLLKKWPTDAVLLILGIVAVSVRMRYFQCLLVIITSNVVYIALLFLNRNWAPDTPTTIANFATTIGVLLALSYVFVTSSYQNEAMHRNEFIHHRALEQENKQLKDKLDEVEAASKGGAVINTDSPLERIITRLNTLLVSLKDPHIDATSMSTTISDVVMMLGANSETLLRPDFGVSGAGHVDKLTMQFMMSEMVHNDTTVATSKSRLPRLSGSMPMPPANPTSDTTPVVVVGVEKSGAATDAFEAELLSGALTNWNSDLLDLNARSNGRSISILAMVILKTHNIEEHLAIPSPVATRFFQEVERRYHQVTYHNSAHGADVCHSFYNILLPHIASVTPIDLFAAIIACCGHDVGHPGLNNTYLMNSNAPTAKLYNDRAVLENMHAALIFQIAAQPGHDIFQSLSRAQYKSARAVILDLVLATDLARHFELLSALKIKLSSSSTAAAAAAASDHPIPGRESIVSRVNWFEKDSGLAMRTAIKMADLTHFSKVRPLHIKWNDLVLEEFYRQGELESSQGLEISPFMDRRDRFRLGKNQVGFMNYIVKPLFESARQMFDGVGPACAEIDSNIAYWAAYDDMANNNKDK